jgi:hypothetical protein
MNSSDSDVRARLSWMWVFVMLNMLLADVLSFMSPGALKMLMEGRAEEITITPGFLLLAAVVTQIPLAMVVLSQMLPKRANRWANVIVGVLTIAYVWGGGTLSAPHYLFIAGLETLGCLYIGWFAWRSYRADVRVPARDLVAA